MILQHPELRPHCGIMKRLAQQVRPRVWLVPVMEQTLFSSPLRLLIAVGALPLVVLFLFERKVLMGKDPEMLLLQFLLFFLLRLFLQATPHPIHLNVLSSPYVRNLSAFHGLGGLDPVENSYQQNGLRQVLIIVGSSYYS